MPGSCGDPALPKREDKTMTAKCFIKLSRCVLALAVTLSLVPSGVHAQGGKAKPLPIEFQRGRDNATVAGKLRGAAQTEYVVGAKKDQKLTIKLFAAPPGSIIVKARDADGADLELRSDSKQQWSATLPKDGDYELRVVRASDKPGVSRYRLTVTIR